LIRTSQQPSAGTSSVTVPLLSPPAQFGQPGQPGHRDDKGYVTLPRRLPSTAASPTHSGLMDWSLMTDRGPVYDGVGPRTSASGRKASQGNPDPEKMASIPGAIAGIRFRYLYLNVSVALARKL
jgi:hypothetical protein